MLRGRNLCRPAPRVVFFFHYCRFLLHLPIIFYIYLRLFDGINLKLGYERGESENCDDYILLELMIMNRENLKYKVSPNVVMMMIMMTTVLIMI